MDPRVEKIMKAAEYIAARLEGRKPFAGIVLGSILWYFMVLRVKNKKIKIK